MLLVYGTMFLSGYRKKMFQALAHVILIQKQLVNLLEIVIWETLRGIATFYICIMYVCVCICRYAYVSTSPIFESVSIHLFMKSK